ncbi:hypothetical protein ACVMII_003903 [Bradyrhizobium diazoefficiens]
MIIGHGAKQLEARIAKVLYNGGSVYDAREVRFLQTLCRRIERYGEQAFISDDQTNWLYRILIRTEQRTGRAIEARTRCNGTAVHSAGETALDGFDIMDALEPEGEN